MALISATAGLASLRQTGLRLDAVAARAPGITVLLLAAAATVAWALHAPPQLRNPSLLVEDARVFLPQAAENGWRALLTPYAGYLHAAPRLLFSLLPAVADIVQYARVVWLLSLLGAGMVFAFLLTTSAPWINRVLLTAGVAVVCPPAEVVGNITNLQWLLAVTIAVAAIERPEQTHRSAWTTCTMLVLAGLSGPFSAMCAAAAVFAFGPGWVRSIRGAIITGTGLVQGAVFLSVRDRGPGVSTDIGTWTESLARTVGDPFVLMPLAYLLVLLLVSARTHALHPMVRNQVFLLMFGLAVLFSGWVRYSGQPGFNGLLIGDLWGRFHFTVSAFVLLGILWPAAFTPWWARAAILTGVAWFGLQHFITPFARDEWGWNYAVARAESLGETEITGAPPPYWSMPLVAGMKGFGTTYARASEGVSRSALPEATLPTCDGRVDVTRRLGGLRRARELRGSVAVPARLGTPGFVVARSARGEVLGYGPVRRPYQSVVLRNGDHATSASYLAYTRNMQHTAKLIVLSSTYSPLCRLADSALSSALGTPEDDE